MMIMIIGEHVKVAASRSPGLLGLKGQVVLETMNTLTIRTTASRNVTLPKTGSALELAGGRIVLGDDLRGRLEDRIAISAGRAQGRRRSR
ncbi:MAG TPA: ribonuclease P protein subunit [Nitrososphaerales archaeon]|nr:ribonuclease P protein subunit [Nitrososphaerales archaeon]